MAEILAHVMRGENVESVHRGNLVVVDKDYKIIFSLGEPMARTYWRSAAKPFQVLPMVEAGGIEKYGFNDEEIAVMAGSHGGEEGHVERVRGILAKMGRDAKDLDCGPAAPLYWPRAKRMLELGERYGQIHNPCSGKHSSMIALALIKDFELKDYIMLNHPVQKMMLSTVADVSGLKTVDIGLGIDGCGVPVFELPLYNMALAYSKLALPRGIEDALRQKALRRIAKAMVENPYYVAGSRRLDTSLMEVTKGRLVAKIGAEGVYCIGVIGEGIGIALKIEDGSSRAIDAVVLKLLKRLQLISDTEYGKLKSQCKLEIKNHRGDIIGRIKAVF